MKTVKAVERTLLRVVETVGSARAVQTVDIKPQPAPGEPAERWNWDAPILVSPHDPSRLYFGSQRVWRSDDRGDSWTALSGDLTTDTNRYTLEFMDRVWSIDSLYDTVRWLAEETD